MLSLLQWSLGSRHEKMSSKKNDIGMFPVSRVPTAHHKRKRSIGITPSKVMTARPSKKHNANKSVDIKNSSKDTTASVNVSRQVDGSLIQQTSSFHPSETKPNLTSDEPHPDMSSLRLEETPTAESVAALTPLQQSIEAQFSLEILLKHNELRLIDQEIAKCQVSLEQLRRCQIIPYPAMSSNSAAMLNVSSGAGDAYYDPSLQRQVEYPAPWGVVDGPYSRHYARWLIPDPAFDGVVQDQIPARGIASQSLPDRQSRSGKTVKGSDVPRTQRGSDGRLQALPAGYPERKEEKGPMIIKRPSDGKMVKLVCLDCRRENFNSVQGFINHCRIAHQRGFASHGEAANASGEEVEFDDSGAVVSDAPPAGGVTGYVHPLIRTAPTTFAEAQYRKPITKWSSKPRSALSCNAVKPSYGHAQAPIPAREPKRNPTSEVPFQPSPATPHLSNLVQLSGRGGDLAELVQDMTSKVNVDEMDVDDSDDENGGSGASPPNTPASKQQNGIGRLPMKSSPPPASSAHGGGAANTTKTGRVPNSIQVNHDRSSRATTSTSGPHSHDFAVDHSLGSPNAPFDLSPRTTDTYAAPSLVSDYEEDDDYDEQQSSVESSENEDEHSDQVAIEVTDKDNDEEIRRRKSSVDPELRTWSKARSYPRRGAAGAGEPEEKSTAATRKRRTRK
jgi:ADA HAT complex component 1